MALSGKESNKLRSRILKLPFFAPVKEAKCVAMLDRSS